MKRKSGVGRVVGSSASRLVERGKCLTKVVGLPGRSGREGEKAGNGPTIGSIILGGKGRSPKGKCSIEHYPHSTHHAG